LRRIATQARRCCKQTPKTKKKKTDKETEWHKGHFWKQKTKKKQKGTCFGTLSPIFNSIWILPNVIGLIEG
jgi:hypothetical protein